MNHQLSIIIVTFNSSKVIEKCLSNLNQNIHNVIVVDNASTDNTIQIITQKFPQIKIIKNNKNIGYGRGNNIALKQIKTDFALILNPDAFIFEEDIEKIITLMTKNPQIALAAPLLLTHYPILEEDKNQQLQIVKKNLIKKFDEYLSVKYLIGAILFLNMNIFRKIGFFDERIFLYYEDDEISWRSIKNGYKAVILPQAQGFHIGSNSSGNKLRDIYRRFWHRALSKLYWKQKQKGRLIAIKSAIRLVAIFLLKSIFYATIFNPKESIANLASCCGSISFLIGLTAFDKNDNPRG